MGDRIYELAAQVHQLVSENPKISKWEICKKLKAGNTTIDQMERDGLIPKIYKPTKPEHTRRKKDGGGWKSGLDFESRGNRK